MPKGIRFGVDTLFGDSSLPAIPYTLNGAPKVRARFLATTGVGKDPRISTWTSLDGGTAMTPKAGTAPARTTVDGYSVAKFNGVDNQLQADLAQSRPHSMAVAFYIHALPSTLGVIVGGQVNPGADPALHDSGMLQIGDAAFGSHWNIHAGVAGDWGLAAVGWHTAVVSFGATTTTGRIDGVATTRDIGRVPRKIITLGGHRSAYYINISVAELVAWDVALTDTEAISIESAMRDHYGII